MTLIAAVLFPLLSALLCWFKPLRSIAWGITVFYLTISFAAAVMTAGQVLGSGRVVAIPGWIEVDGLGSLVLLLVTFVCTLAAIFAGGYMRHGSQSRERLWWFYSNSNLLVFALAVVPALASPNLAWVGVELVTLFATLLVAYESTAGALEAAWKMAILTIMGAPIALLGFLVLYWAFRSSGGGTAETWAALSAMSSTMPPNLLKFSFLLVFVGFGAKVGLAPMHTWLPDAHSQAPTPVCAVLSGIKTTVGMAGATVYRGIEGYGASTRIHHASHWTFSKDAPIMLTVIDREEQIEKLIPHLDVMVEEGLIAMSRVEVIRYSRTSTDEPAKV